MSHQEIDYVDIMRSNGLRVTSQRLLILDAICEGHGHTTLGHIYARVRQKGSIH
jgi:Fe2+ or Zn2+ uptake regulation protein